MKPIERWLSCILAFSAVLLVLLNPIQDASAKTCYDSAKNPIPCEKSDYRLTQDAAKLIPSSTAIPQIPTFILAAATATDTPVPATATDTPVPATETASATSTATPTTAIAVPPAPPPPAASVPAPPLGGLPFFLIASAGILSIVLVIIIVLLLPAIIRGFKGRRAGVINRPPGISTASRDQVGAVNRSSTDGFTVVPPAAPEGQGDVGTQFGDDKNTFPPTPN